MLTEESNRQTEPSSVANSLVEIDVNKNYKKKEAALGALGRALEPNEQCAVCSPYVTQEEEGSSSELTCPFLGRPVKALGPCALTLTCVPHMKVTLFTLSFFQPLKHILDPRGSFVYFVYEHMMKNK